MAKTSTSNISIRMDSELKVAAEALFEELGMNLSTAFNIFVRRSLRERGIPFMITKGNPTKKPSLQCLRQKGSQKLPQSKVTVTQTIYSQILIHKKTTTLCKF